MNRRELLKGLVVTPAVLTSAEPVVDEAQQVRELGKVYAKNTATELNSVGNIPVRINGVAYRLPVYE